MKRATDKKPQPKIKLSVRKDMKALSSDSLPKANEIRIDNKRDLITKSCGITRPESPSFKQKNSEIDLLIGSMDKKNKSAVSKNKVDSFISTDNLMMEIPTLKSNTFSKLSPILTKIMYKTQVSDR